jgi:hypothetical protein
MSCSFCGRQDNFIYLVCEGQCLICVNCVHQSSIKSLFLESARNPPLKCPICETLVTKTLKQMIDVFEKEETIVGVAKEYDFSTEESVFAAFIREFRCGLGYGGLGLKFWRYFHFYSCF